MKKRRMKLMALMLTVCVGGTSMTSAWAANLNAPVTEQMTTSESETGFQAEEGLDADENIEEELTGDLFEIMPEVPDEEEPSVDDVLEGKATVVILGQDAKWEETPGDEPVPADSVNQRLRKLVGDTGYYTEADGLVEVRVSDTESYTYVFDENGFIRTGVITIEEAEYYFNTKADAGKLAVKENVPVVGTMVKDGWRLLNNGKTWGYFDSTGVRCVKDGYVEIDGEHYYLDQDGDILTGHIDVDGVSRYFSLISNPMGQEEERSVDAGWILEGDAWKYMTDTGKVEIRTGLQHIISGSVDEWYCLDEEGVPMTNVMKMHTNGRYYYFGADGTRTDNKFVTVDGKKYYFTTYGARATYKNAWKTINNRKYYFGADSSIELKTGWYKIGSYWYYFSAAGNMQHDRFVTEGGKKYYLNSNGVMVGGLRKINGYYYYFKWSQGNTRYGYALTNRWVKTKGDWYYANSSGRMQKGWIALGTKQYYLDDNYKLVTNKWVTNKSGVRGYLDNDGVFHKGNTWVNVNGKWRYLKDGAANGWATGWTRINGYKYYFQGNGDMLTDLSKMAGFTGGPYKYDVNRTTCTITVLGKDENGQFTVPVIAFACSVGLWNTPTPTGTYGMTRYNRWQPLMGPSWGQYGTHVDGAGQGGIFFHSVAGAAPNNNSISAGEYNKLGSPASHGCIRLTVRDAKWIWDHWGSGGNIAYIHDGSGNIFYKPSVPKIPGHIHYDPTDPTI